MSDTGKQRWIATLAEAARVQLQQHLVLEIAECTDHFGELEEYDESKHGTSGALTLVRAALRRAT